jgi:pSer/pThr/pTyr-binding forkhead associated (FHA) protein
METPLLVVLGLIAVFGVGLVLAFRKPGKPRPAPAASVKSATKRHWLVAQNGPERYKAWHVGSRQVTIGRTPANFIQVADDGVSRRQCKLFPDGACLVIEDLKSSNGTMVNGELIARYVLSEGDLVKVGETLLKYLPEGDFDNAALLRKEAGPSAVKQTAAMTGLKRILEAEEHLLAADGNVDKAAYAMGIKLEEFQALLAAGQGE